MHAYKLFTSKALNTTEPLNLNLFSTFLNRRARKGFAEISKEKTDRIT